MDYTPSAMDNSSKPSYKSAEEWHVYHAYHDPEFKNAISKLGGSTASMVAYRSIAADFAVPALDVRRYHQNLLTPIPSEPSVFRMPKYAVRFDQAEQKYYIEVPANINRTAFEEIWESISLKRQRVDTYTDGTRFQARQGDTTKRKPPQETSLLYAIFRARRKLTFTEIFKLYQDGRLPLYHGSTAQFKSPDSLEAYYHKYMPGKPKATT